MGKMKERRVRVRVRVCLFRVHLRVQGRRHHRRRETQKRPHRRNHNKAACTGQTPFTTERPLRAPISRGFGPTDRGKAKRRVLPYGHVFFFLYLSTFLLCGASLRGGALQQRSFQDRSRCGCLHCCVSCTRSILTHRSSFIYRVRKALPSRTYV